MTDMDPNKTHVLKSQTTPSASGNSSNHAACLVIMSGQPLGKIFHLQENNVTIGREPNNTIQIEDEAVSRTHTRVFYENNQWLIEDQNSTNGTFINFKRIQKQEIKNSDVISIGKTVFKFIREDNLESAYYREIYELSTKDGLTNLANKRYFNELLTKEISRVKRHQDTFSIMMMDIDHFKKVNDQYGHPAGDYVLKQIADILQGNVRQEDLLARFGGEEFICLLTNAKVKAGAKIAEKMRQLVAEHQFLWDQIQIPVTMSFGLTEFQNSDTNETLIERADQKLYEAKNKGRNRVCY